jgi:hypothetical protein
MPPPKVFISYSYDSEAHKDWVAKLASDLVDRGIEVTLDKWDLELGEDIAAFMERSVANANRVLLVCTDAYVEKANEGRGGVGYERLIVSAEIVAKISTKKFIPLLRTSGTPTVPNFLGPRRYLDFSDQTQYDARVEELARELHGVPAAGRPALGPNPYAAIVSSTPQPGRVAGPSGLLESGQRLLSDAWFEERAAEARRGIEKLELGGAMQIRMAVHEPIRKSQLELLSALRNAQVHTFGWPIGVTLENQDEHKPRPFNDGIRAEVSISERALTRESSYDYWAAKNNGDFYTLQSFFEDMRAEKKLFFNTQIVRITEGLMLASSFYQQLGVPSDSRMSIQFTHSGLAGRTLASSTPDRQIWPRKAAEDRSEAEVTDSVAGLRTNIVDHVEKVAEPMFMLFDFATFDRTIYDQIVTAYVNGRAT